MSLGPKDIPVWFGVGVKAPFMRTITHWWQKGGLVSIHCILTEKYTFPGWRRICKFKGNCENIANSAQLGWSLGWAWQKFIGLVLLGWEENSECCIVQPSSCIAGDNVLNDWYADCNVSPRANIPAILMTGLCAGLCVHMHCSFSMNLATVVSWSARASVLSLQHLNLTPHTTQTKLNVELGFPN